MPARVPEYNSRVQEQALPSARYAPQAPVEAFGGAMIGLCKDLDGYVVELLQAPS